MKHKIILVFSILFLILCQAYSQQFKYFKDFDFQKMAGTGILTDINALPDFYVQCEYNISGKLS